jgi:hypothetical protein
MRQNVSESLEASRLELLRRACTHGDLQAWVAFQQSLEETVLTWLHEHPGFEAALYWLLSTSVRKNEKRTAFFDCSLLQLFEGVCVHY